MAEKVYDVCHGSEYQGREGKKTKWVNIGVVFKNPQGNLSMKIDYIPLGIDPVKGLRLNLFVPKPREDQPPPQRQQPPMSNEDMPPDDGNTVPF